MRDAERLAHWGGTIGDSPAALRGMVAACERVRSMVYLCDARGFSDLAKSPAFVGAVAAARATLEPGVRS